MNDFIFKLILALIPVIGVVLTGFIIPMLQTKIGNEKLAQYMVWTKNAVQYAEMVFDLGTEKKHYCVQFLDGLINRDKKVLTVEQIDVLIESAVQELKLAEKAVVGK